MDKLQKADVREKMKRLRANLSPAYRAAASRRIGERALEFVRKSPRIKTVGVYMSKGAEVDTAGILAGLSSLNKKIAAPRSYSHRPFLRFYELKKGAASCAPGYFGILEPLSTCAWVRKVDLVLVPGIAFDRSGHRLGYGLGYYDRFLEKNRVPTLGLTYEKTFLKRLPSANHDRPVRAVVTEKRIFWNLRI